MVPTDQPIDHERGHEAHQQQPPGMLLAWRGFRAEDCEGGLGNVQRLCEQMRNQENCLHVACAGCARGKRAANAAARNVWLWAANRGARGIACGTTLRLRGCEAASKAPRCRARGGTHRTRESYLRGCGEGSKTATHAPTRAHARARLTAAAGFRAGVLVLAQIRHAKCT